ncbi:MAG: hypothetical protein E3K37_15375 [Candidatus Kuenenia sp.]|nr:hypothetical protein [Candidatus Kuenenia hertensis]
MLSIKIGQYHPSLENSFVDTLLTTKKEDPFAPIAVVAPTNYMLEHLQARLVKKHDASLLNVFFLNFYLLAEEICRNAKKDAGHILRESFIYERLITKLVEQEMQRTPSFKNVTSPSSIARSIFHAMQDLADANVNADDLKASVKEHIVDGADIQKLSDVSRLFSLFQTTLKSLNISHYSNLYYAATKCVPDSEYLGKFKHILAYGFYDLTGVEQDFFSEIFRYYPTILFLPYKNNHSAFTYVKYFYESFLLGIARDIEELPPHEHQGFSYLMDTEKETRNSSDEKLILNTPSLDNLSIINVSGKHDEIWVIAKEIHKLADKGYVFGDIGIVARELDPYINIIQEIFQENYIPFTTHRKEPIDKYPLFAIIKQLLLLNRENFYRPMVIDILESPYFNTPLPVGVKDVMKRPDIWDSISRIIGVHSDIHCWLSKLEQLKNAMAKPTDEDIFPHTINISCNQIEFLKTILQQLSNDLLSLQEKATWTQMCHKINLFLNKYIHIPSDGIDEEIIQRDIFIKERITYLLDTFSILDRVDKEITYDQFADTFINACKQEGIRVGITSNKGVKVTDAMSARGIPFRVLFLIGLNEKEFPRFIFEEPFLRDHTRRRLSEVLGNHIPEKLKGFDEERLLFYFLLNAAQERLYLLYERSDEAGKPKTPSHYIMDIRQNIKRLYSGNENAEDNVHFKICVPRGIKNKLCREDVSLLTPNEAVIRMTLDHIDPSDCIKAIGMNNAAYTRSKRALHAMESFTPYLSAYDGVISDVERWYKKRAQKGFTPTMLEAFGACPFKFFMGEILQLEPLEDPENDIRITSPKLGNLYHGILDKLYCYLREREYFKEKADNINPLEYLRGIANESFAKMEKQIPIPYPLLWEITKDEIITCLLHFLPWDLKQIKDTGYIPTFIETRLQVALPKSAVDENTTIFFTGKIDRIDLKKDGQEIYFRLVDYKSGRARDENLLRSAVRGQKLQLPFYITMAEQFLMNKYVNEVSPHSEIKFDEASFVYIALDMIDKKGERYTQKNTINNNDWTPHKELFWTTVYEFLTIIRKGLFPPMENKTYCQWCEFTTACRKGHQPSRFRQEHDERLATYRNIIADKTTKTH